MRLRPCDVYANYHFEVVIDENVNLYFVHRDGMRTAYAAAFVCTNTGLAVSDRAAMTVLAKASPYGEEALLTGWSLNANFG